MWDRPAWVPSATNGASCCLATAPRHFLPQLKKKFFSQQADQTHPSRATRHYRAVLLSLPQNAASDDTVAQENRPTPHDIPI